MSAKENYRELLVQTDFFTGRWWLHCLPHDQQKRISAKWTEWKAKIMFSSDVCVSVCLCVSSQCVCQSNIYVAPKVEGRIWGAGVWVTRRDRQKRKGEI